MNINICGIVVNTELCIYASLYVVIALVIVYLMWCGLHPGKVE